MPLRINFFLHFDVEKKKENDAALPNDDKHRPSCWNRQCVAVNNKIYFVIMCIM